MNWSLNWDDVRIALATAQHGTHAAAATELKINPATVARRLARMEADLGAALFYRHEGQWLTTEFGDTVLEQAAKMSEVAQTIQQISQSETQAVGTVRITATESLTNHILVPHLQKLWDMAPQISVELQPSASNLSIAKRESDIAIRLARPTEDGTVIRHLGDIGFGLYARRKTEPDIHNSPWIAYDASLDDKPEAQWCRTLRGNGPVALRTGDVNTIQEAIAQGLGVGVLPCFMGHRDPRLQRIVTPSPAPTRPVWIAIPETLKHKPRIRTAANWVTAVFRELKNELIGF